MSRGAQSVSCLAHDARAKCEPRSGADGAKRGDNSTMRMFGRSESAVSGPLQRCLCVPRRRRTGAARRCEQLIAASRCPELFLVPSMDAVERSVGRQRGKRTVYVWSGLEVRSGGSIAVCTKQILNPEALQRKAPQTPPIGHIWSVKRNCRGSHSDKFNKRATNN